MIRTLRLFFLSRLLREKVLLVGFAVLGAAIWLSSLSNRIGQFGNTVRTTSDKLKEQQGWIARKSVIDAAALKATERLDPAKTLNNIQLYAEVNNLIQASGLPGNAFGNPQTRPDSTSGEFSFHTLEFSLNNVEWGAFKTFYASVLARAPYMTVTYFDIRPRGGNLTQHTVQMRVSAIETK